MRMTWLNLLLVVAVATVRAQNADIVNSKVERTVDISNQLVTITCRITIENNGKSPLSQYLFTVDESHRTRLAYINAAVGSTASERKKNSLQVTKQTGEQQYRVELGSHQIAAGASGTVDVEAVYTRLLTPYPEEIQQAERQLVQYVGNTYFFSPYLTKTQTTKVKLPPGGSTETYSKLKPVVQSGTEINYGPYENIAANSVHPLRVHYENNLPFLVATNVERTIEISHWAGLLSVEEVIDVSHDGAKLKGPFSRYDFQREPNNGLSAIKSWKTRLPLSAQDVYYRDDIGNISTSNVIKRGNNLVAELRPRFPLFGGWKTHYTLGYYLPTHEYLFNDGNQFILRIPFVGHLYDHSVVESAEVRVVLPEGASDVKLRLPFTATREKDQIRKTYLDTFGRTVVVLRKENLVDKHSQDLEVHYSFNRIYMLQEPLLLVVALFILCVLIMISVRLDVSITSGKPSKVAADSSVASSESSKSQKKKTH